MEEKLANFGSSSHIVVILGTTTTTPTPIATPTGQKSVDQPNESSLNVEQTPLPLNTEQHTHDETRNPPHGYLSDIPNFVDFNIERLTNAVYY